MISETVSSAFVDELHPDQTFLAHTFIGREYGKWFIEEPASPNVGNLIVATL